MKSRRKKTQVLFLGLKFPDGALTGPSGNTRQRSVALAQGLSGGSPTGAPEFEAGTTPPGRAESAEASNP